MQIREISNTALGAKHIPSIVRFFIFYPTKRNKRGRHSAQILVTQYVLVAAERMTLQCAAAHYVSRSMPGKIRSDEDKDRARPLKHSHSTTIIIRPKSGK